VIVIGKVPIVTPSTVLTVSVEPKIGVLLTGLNEAVAPVGNPLALRVTVPGAPLTWATSKPYVAELPSSTVAVSEPTTEIWKSLVTPLVELLETDVVTWLTTRVIGAVLVCPPPVPVIVIG
jgi:hypothetical protein